MHVFKAKTFMENGERVFVLSLAVNLLEVSVLSTYLKLNFLVWIYFKNNLAMRKIAYIVKTVKPKLFHHLSND